MEKPSVTASIINNIDLINKVIPSSSDKGSLLNNQDFFYNIPMNNSAVEKQDRINMKAYCRENLNDMNENVIRYV